MRGRVARRRTLLEVSLIAGVVAAVVEMLVILPIQGLIGVNPAVLFQSIAMGALGRAAFRDGGAAVALGAAVHLLISVVSAGLYAAAARRWPVLLRRAALCGAAYGVVVYLVMTFGMVPLSAIGFNLPKTAALALLSLAVHVLAFGLPIGLAVRALTPRPPPA
jgi:uncharacterized membrane protein YagU involved in acid resistance